MNARDPFSTSNAAIGKQRYGFELTGPIRKEGTDFALTLEHRTIDNFAVVNAITLDTAGNQTTYPAERRHAAAPLARHRATSTGSSARRTPSSPATTPT